MKDSYFRLDGAVALVTGANRGLGKGLALEIAQAGADVALVDITIGNLDEIAEQVRRSGRNALKHQADITVETEVFSMVQKVVAELGRIDILINCAGVAHRVPAHETTLDVWQETINVNLQGVFLCGREVGRQMIRQNSGAIVNIASINCAVARPNLSAYGASKAGVMQLTRCWALEWAPYNIRVNAVAPSFLKTEMTENLFNDPAVFRRLVDSTPLQRIGTIDDIAAPVIFLASEGASYITGQTLFADGGWTIQ